MATTTNYSWTTPDDTDLVKDGASAIRTLGSAIDTTVFTNAGAAIQKSIVDAAGDLIYATANDTPARLALGTAGQVLQVNSGATAPEWAAPAAGGGLTQLATGTLSGGQVDLTSISGSYIDLVLVITDLETTAASGQRLRVNADSGNNYRGVAIRNVSGVPNLENNGTATAIVATAGYATATGSNNNTWIYRIYNYADTTCFKLISFIGAFKENGGALIEVDFRGVYIQTSAISQINIVNESSTYSAGTYTLYGVK